jgi:hypothetical protein
VIYGASGYTGRLVAEFLREFKIPFVAAGRSKERLADALAVVPGIEDASYEIIEVEHTVEALTELFRGRTVVSNLVGPFARHAHPVIEAALAAGCHYIDSSAEQEYMLQAQEQWGPQFAERDLVLGCDVAYLQGVAEIAARFVLETEGIDSLTVGGYGGAVPTVASTQSFEIVSSKAHQLLDRELIPYSGIEPEQVTVPFASEVVTTSHWGGGPLPVWLRADPRVRNVRSTYAMANQDIIKGVLELERAYKVSLQWLPVEQRRAALDQLAGQMTAGIPPRENRQVHRALDWCHGRGNTVAASCQIYSTAGYQQTGLLHAYAAVRLLGGSHRCAGFRSPCELFGHRELFAALQSYGYASMNVERVAA